jgi:hypothetical protein
MELREAQEQLAEKLYKVTPILLGYLLVLGMEQYLHK